jgi:hypothetical protein
MALITDATFDSLRETLGLSRKAGVTESHARSYRDPNVIQIPGSFFPHADFEDALWIKIKAKKIANLKTGGRGGTLTIAEHGPTWKFLAPDEIVEVHNHEWDNYESFHSKILEKIRSFGVGWDTTVEAAGQLYQEGQRIAKKVWDKPTTDGLLSDIKEGLIRGSSTTVPETKIDTPLVYMSSGRRRYDFNFILADPEGAKLVHSIKLLQKYAAPDTVDEYRIDFPWIFEITSEPSELLKVSFAAMVSIQPTYQQPYVNGNPVKAELQLSFEDMSPLFKKTIEEGTIINVKDDAERTSIVTQQTESERQRTLEIIK